MRKVKVTMICDEGFVADSLRDFATAYEDNFGDEIGSRTRKDAAINLAKESVLNLYPNAEFKLNAVSERVR